MSEAQKIINWAASQHDGLGGEVQAIRMAIDSGSLDSITKNKLEEKAAKWVSQWKN